ncbi:MAG: prepilin-type N-terminal cleavage/methylation domain-containing protein [Alphaproteobacteria bacterium]|nr:prepilin-type N-terminal cleavage/methylation domain-containing protein [Alphaproteobacteria bacterium]
MFQPTRPDSGPRAGFSLVEVLCALAIAAMAMVTLMRGMGTSQLAASRMDNYLGARIIAQAIIEDELSAAETTADQREGKSGPYDWRFVIAPTTVNGLTGLPSEYTLYRLSAEVTWSPRGRFALEALKLVK